MLVYCKSVPSQTYTMNIVFDQNSSKYLWSNYSWIGPWNLNFSVFENYQLQSQHQTIWWEGWSYHRFLTRVMNPILFQGKCKIDTIGTNIEFHYKQQIFIRPCVLYVQEAYKHVRPNQKQIRLERPIISVHFILRDISQFQICYIHLGFWHILSMYIYI